VKRRILVGNAGGLHGLDPAAVACPPPDEDERGYAMAVGTLGPTTARPGPPRSRAPLLGVTPATIRP